MISTAVGAASRTASPVRRILLVVALALLLWGAVCTPRAAAHAELLETVPADGEVLDAPPDRLELIFNEPVRVVDGSVRLFAPDGTDTVLDTSVRDHAVLVDLPPTTTDGGHTVAYRVVSADGHPIGGAVTYGVGSLTGAGGERDGAVEDSPRSTELLVATSAGLQYLGLVLLVGLLGFDRLVLRRDHRDPSPFRRLVRGAWVAALVGSLLQVPAVALRAGGGEAWLLFRPADWWSAISAPTVIGAACVAGAGGLAALVGGGVGQRAGVRGAASWVALGAAALALSAPVWVGHTQTMVPRWLGVLADLVHLAAASVWVGGLLGLAVLLRRSRPDASTPEGTVPRWGDSERLAGTVVRFSVAALGSVLALVASGATMAVLILPTWSSLLGTGYGRTLLVKVGMVTAVVALAGWNRFRLVPALRAQPREADRWLQLRAILRRELALVLAVVAITGFLSTSSPVHDQHSTDGGSAVVLAAESQGLSVDGTVTPGTQGTNTLDFTLAHHGHAFDDAEVTVRASLPEQGLGPIEAVPEPDPATGRYRAELTLPAAGEWRVEIAARTSTYDQPIVVVPVSVS